MSGGLFEPRLVFSNFENLDFKILHWQPMVVVAVILSWITRYNQAKMSLLLDLARSVYSVSPECVVSKSLIACAEWIKTCFELPFKFEIIISSVSSKNGRTGMKFRGLYDVVWPTTRLSTSSIDVT